MDAALRQRLIGAAVLILLAVVFVPMLLDGPPSQGEAQEVSLDIPPRPHETRRLPVDPDQTPTTAPATIDRSQPTAPLADIPTQSPSPSAVGLVPVVPPPTPTPAPKPDRPPAAAPAAPVVAAVDEPGGRYVVRFGSFGDRSNAERLVNRLNAAGIGSAVEPVTSGSRTLQRVRSKAMADRTAAEKVRLQARKALPEVSAQVVELDLPTQTASRVSNPVASGWAVQVGVFSTQATADKLAGELKAAGFEGYVERLPSSGKVLYRVRVGPLARRSEANRVLAEIKSKRKLDGLVVSYP